MDSDAFNRGIAKNPFNFNSTNVSLAVDGEETPQKALEFRFDKNNYIMRSP